MAGEFSAGDAGGGAGEPVGIDRVCDDPLAGGVAGGRSAIVRGGPVDGAGPWQRFLHITLPGIRPMFIFLLIVVNDSRPSLFELPWVFFGGPGPGNAGLTVVMGHSVPVRIPGRRFRTASAVGWVLATLIFLFTIVQIKLPARHGRLGNELQAATNAGATLLLHLLLAVLAAAAVVPFCWLVCAKFHNSGKGFACRFCRGIDLGI